MPDPVPGSAGAGNPDPNSTPPPAPIDWGAHIPTEMAQEKFWEPIKGKPLADVLKGYGEAQKMIGGSIRLPNEKDKPEDRSKKLDDIYNKLGRPARPDEYKSGSLPEGLALDETRDASFKTTAHKMGLNQSQVDGLYQWFGQYMQAGQEGLQAQRQDGEAALKKDWGANYDTNVALASRGLAHLANKVLGPEEGKALLADLDRTGIGSSARLVKLFAALGGEMQEDGLITGESDVSADALQAQEAELTKPGTPFWDKFHPDHEKAVQQVERLRAQIGNPLMASR